MIGSHSGCAVQRGSQIVVPEKHDDKSDQQYGTRLSRMSATAHSTVDACIHAPKIFKF